jgi:hypothetical protein
LPREAVVRSRTTRQATTQQATGQDNTGQQNTGQQSTTDESAAPPTLRQVIRGDFAAASGLKLLAIVLLLAWMAFQWGLGNDILLPTIAANGYDSVDDGETWSRGLAAVGVAALAGGGFWAMTQALDAVVVLGGLRLIPGITERLSSYLRRKGWVTPYAEMKWSTRWIIAYATGVSLLCLIDVFATGTQGVKQRRGMIAGAVALSAGTVGALVALVAGAALTASRIPATEDGAVVFIRFAKNPLTWVVIYAVVFLVGRLTGKSFKTADGLDDDDLDPKKSQPQDPVTT